MHSHSYDKLVCIHDDIYSIRFKFPILLLRICGSWVQMYVFTALTGQENGGWWSAWLFPFSISKMLGNLVQELVIISRCHNCFHLWMMEFFILPSPLHHLLRSQSPWLKPGHVSRPSCQVLGSLDPASTKTQKVGILSK